MSYVGIFPVYLWMPLILSDFQQALHTNKYLNQWFWLKPSQQGLFL